MASERARSGIAQGRSLPEGAGRGLARVAGWEASGRRVERAAIDWFPHPDSAGAPGRAEAEGQTIAGAVQRDDAPGLAAHLGSGIPRGLAYGGDRRKHEVG